MKEIIHTKSIKAVIFCTLLNLITPLNADIPWLHVDGNRIKDPQGNVVVLRGLQFAELYWYEHSGGTIKMIDRITDKNDSQGNSPGWYPKILRIPITPHDEVLGYIPYRFTLGDDSFYNDHLRPVVDYCAEKDLYVIICLGDFGDTWRKFSQTSEFWRYMAPRFANDSHVLFELFNEPINFIEYDSNIDNWLSVRTDMQTWMDIVRSYAPHNIILVGGPSWSMTIGPAATYPVSGNNIVYVSHLYPAHWLGIFDSTQWYRNQITSCATVHPVIMTEWGFSQSCSSDTDVLLNGTISNYGQPLMDFIEGLKISNTAHFAHNQGSIFYEDWTLRCGEGEMGCFVKDKLYEKRNDDQPHGEVQIPIDLSFLEDFETGNFNKFSWWCSGDDNWTITQQEDHSGAHSAKAGEIDDDESSILRVNVECVSGNITFYRKVSSESDFDYLKFYIDGEEQGEWSGELDWAEVSFAVNAGKRTFEWTYSKDDSASRGDDTAWIDDITFPAADEAEPPEVPFTRGVNLTNWLQASSIQQIQFTKYIKQDLINIKNLGCDVVRLPINLHAMTSGWPDYKIDPLFYYYLDQIVDWAEELELHLILDNHSFDPAVDTSPDIGDILVPVWTQMAQHYKDRSTYIYYEVLNEPHGISDTTWNRIQQEVIDAIRAVDQTHTIIVGPAGWNSYNNLKFMSEYEDDNLIYTFHFYDPLLFTHQGASWTNPSLVLLAGVPFPCYAGDMPSCPPELQNTSIRGDLANYRNTGTAEYVKELIDIVAEFQTTRNVPLLCGEFGVYMPNSNDECRLYWYSLVRSYLELKGIAWTMRDYNGDFGLFKHGTEKMINYDLNIPLVQALGWTGPPQKIRPDVKGFDLYVDNIESNIKEPDPLFGEGLLDFYSRDNPVSGDYCLHWTSAKSYDHIKFRFSPVKDLSMLVDEGFVIDFWIRCDNASAKFDIRFVDTKTDEPNDHPWSICYTINRNMVDWNGEWNHLQIPLKEFYEVGSWDDWADGYWFEPVGAFDWTATERFEITPHYELVGIHFYFDNIRVVEPDSTVVHEPSLGFDMYLDDIGPNIIESEPPNEGFLDYDSQDNPACGDYCIHLTGVSQWNGISFRFSPVKDLSKLVDEGFVVDLWVRCDNPSAKVEMEFIDTKTNEPSDHPWSRCYTIDENIADWNGEWNNLQIPLKEFYEVGSWEGFPPIGAFDWTATEQFTIVTNYDLEGIHFYFDDIRVVEPNPPVSPEPPDDSDLPVSPNPSVSAVPVKVDLSANGDVESGWIDWNSGGKQNNIDIECQFLNEANFDNDFTIKFIKVQTRNRAQISNSVPLHDLLEDDFKKGSAFDMQIKNLAAGEYIITTYHHDPLEDVENDDGTINITVSDAVGTRMVADHLQQSWGREPATVASATFTFVSNGTDDVVITFEDNNDGIHKEAHLNGFELDLSE